MKDGGPIYPVPHRLTSGRNLLYHSEGMTLLQHYAGLAMQAIIISERVNVQEDETQNEGVARTAFGVAQAMLKAQEED